MDERPDPNAPDQDEGIVAYHGSPHDFDQFDLSKIGTGEGAQAYGHGLYFAENEPTAKFYRDSTRPNLPQVIIDNKSTNVPLHQADLLIQNMVKAKKTPEEYYESLVNSQRAKELEKKLATADREDYGLGFSDYDLAKAEHDEFQRTLNDVRGYFGKNIQAHVPKGHMYEVRINAHPDHFLDWDKPLIEQPHIMQAIDQHIGDPEIVFDQLFGHREATGRDLHERFGGEHKPAAVAQRLSGMGIKGIKYLDASSRGGTDAPTRNYVVFDDKHVSVRRKYEQGGAVEGMATGGEVGDETPYHQTPEFQNWFGDSVAHTDGVPTTYYHGTSKDKDYTSFNIGKHGLWVTTDPAEASGYAEQNDSQGYTYDDGKYVKTNTASRVLPVHIKAENPYRGDKPEELFQKQNYKKAQSDWFEQLRSQGYDSWIPDSQKGALAVVLKAPTQVKSIYNRTFDPKNKRMDKAPGGSAVATLRRMSDPAVNEAIRVINRSGSSPRDAVTLSKRLLGRQ